MSSVALVAALLSMQSMVGEAMPLRSLKGGSSDGNARGPKGFVPTKPFVPHIDPTTGLEVWRPEPQPCGRFETDPCPPEKPEHKCGELEADTTMCRHCIEGGESPASCSEAPTDHSQGRDCTCFEAEQNGGHDHRIPPPSAAGCEVAVMHARCKNAQRATIGNCLSCLTQIPQCTVEGAVEATEDYCRHGLPITPDPTEVPTPPPAYDGAMNGACRGPGGATDYLAGKSQVGLSMVDCENACLTNTGCIGYEYRAMQVGTGGNIAPPTCSVLGPTVAQAAAAPWTALPFTAATITGVNAGHTGSICVRRYDSSLENHDPGH